MTRTLSSYRFRRGAAAFVLVALLAIAGGVAWYVTQYKADGEGSEADHDALLHTIERHDFELTVTERGEIESSGSTEVRSQVKTLGASGFTILRIIPEGTTVAKGDFLVELDSSALDSDRRLQQVIVNSSEAATVEAKNIYETAVIAQQEYLDGTFVQELQTFESEAFVAEENLSRAEDYLVYSQRLATKGYVNDLQLQADRFAVEKSRKELEAAKTKIKVLKEFTKAKMLKQFDSDIVIAKAKWESSKNSLQVEVNKLKEIEDQITKCIITAPRAGIVKYAHGEEQHRGDEFVVEEGALIRERQTIIELPDPDSMQVAVSVNESLIQYVRPGMEATVTPVGADDMVLRGRVVRVNQYAEPTNWRRANVKDYKAVVAIEEGSDLLKSGMTASVSISSIFVPEAIQAPVDSVYPHGGQTYCFVDNKGKLVAQPVVCGPTNDRFFVIESGLNPGDRVAANPRRMAAEVDLPRLAPEEVQQTVDTKAPQRRNKLREPEKQPVAKTAAAEEASPSAKGG